MLHEEERYRKTTTVVNVARRLSFSKIKMTETVFQKSVKIAAVVCAYW